MKRQSFPLWLIRDVPAFMGMIVSFWALIIFAMASGGRFVPADKAGKRVHDQLALMLAYAEARLDHALWRQAYRRLGWDPRLAPFNLIAPAASWSDTLERLAGYDHAFRNMNRVVDAYVEHLRAQYGIAKRDLVAHGSMDARLRRAAHHELVGAATSALATSPPALILSSAQSARPSKDERGYAHARGPPPNSISRNQTRTTSQASPARTHRHA